MTNTPPGAANIRPDDTPYADGEIVREGPVGDQGDGPYSAGRGGAGNIAKDATATGGEVGDADIVPETALREAKSENYHYGRGGAGNEHHSRHDKETHESLKEKVKDIFHKKA